MAKPSLSHVSLIYKKGFNVTLWPCSNKKKQKEAQAQTAILRVNYLQHKTKQDLTEIGTVAKYKENYTDRDISEGVLS